MATASEPQRRQCPVCGTANDPFYTYCRQCLAELAGDASRVVRD